LGYVTLLGVALCVLSVFAFIAGALTGAPIPGNERG
jgi:hypothetical protein